MELTGQRQRSVADFSMEIGIDERICTYSGGLGILAGDTIRSAADLRVPMEAVTLLYRKGYFRQRLEADGRQREEPTSWVLMSCFKRNPLAPRSQWKGGPFNLGPGATMSQGVSGYTAPIYFLDAMIFPKTRSGTGG